MGTKRCPYCAEEIQEEATRCRYCRSRVVMFDADAWHRDHAERRLAGVCACLAHAFSVPVAAVRLGFVVFTLFLHIGLLVYATLWLVLPARPGEDSVLESSLRRLLAVIGAAKPRRPDDSLTRPPYFDDTPSQH